MRVFLRLQGDYRLADPGTGQLIVQRIEPAENLLRIQSFLRIPDKSFDMEP